MILTVENLYCYRGDFPVLSNLSFSLNAGQIIALNGKNGSGKTTLLKTLAKVIPTEKGELVNNALGTCLLGHENCLKFDLTVSENLNFWAGIYNTPSIKNEISILNLKELLDTPVRQLSAGQKRKVSLARLLISKSELWLLDEPYASLDKTNQELLNKIMINHLSGPGAIIISTHSPIKLKNIQSIDITQFKPAKTLRRSKFTHGSEK